ncbi:MAG: cation-translocating P-type ATPase [Bacillota bacterium]|nr:cation-translocating P-type ATPase [Bacillota bacterium]
MYFTKSVEEVSKDLNVNIDKGLSNEEVDKRIEKYGLNKIKDKKKRSLFSIFISQLKDMLIYVLLGAAAITFFIGEYVDGVIILLVVFLNALIGVVQENKASQAIEELKKMSYPKALVRRDGNTVEINSEDVVPGDLIILDAGRYVPADIRLIDSANLKIEESSLTGESVPSEKDHNKIFNENKIPIGDRINMAYSSTIVTYGRGEGIAVHTGMETEIGTIAKSLDQEEGLTPLQKRLEELGKVLGFLAVGICVLIFIIAYFQGKDLFDMFLTAISLAVAAIPEGLAAIVAIVLALGVTRMSKQNAIVKRLPAVETLGSVNVICTDKTGTLTQNKMSVIEFYTYKNGVKVSEEDLEEINETEENLIKTFVLCNDATYEGEEKTGDPTEIALIEMGKKYNLPKKTLTENFPRVSEKPFDSDRKLMSTLNKEEKKYRVNTKGAIDNLLKICTKVLKDGEEKEFTSKMKKEFLDASEIMSQNALRVLSCAYKYSEEKIPTEDMEKDLTFIGFVGMMDPPRIEVKDSIVEAKLAGITPIMITGDHKITAFAIAKELDIASSIEEAIEGSELDDLSDDELTKFIKNYKIFARVSPEHKVRIVKAFKDNGNIVSMTGDGVNDAPSLQGADIGVAMGITGTDVAKGASDMILTDDNFSTIVHAVEEGRNIYNNIKKSVVFLLSCNLGEVVAILASILFFWPIPLLPTQILWINLITDSLPAISLGVDPGDKSVMEEKPRDPKESFFAGGVGVRVTIGGFLIGALTLAAFYIGLREYGYSPSSEDIPVEVLTYGRTMAFVVLAASQLFYSLSMRNDKKTIFKIGFLSNKYLIGSIFIGLLLQLGVISIPFLARAFKVVNLSFKDWVIVLSLALIPLFFKELYKLIRFSPKT